MSIHAQLPPETEARLVAQQRKLTISSILIAAIIVILLTTSLFFVFLPKAEDTQLGIISYSTTTEETEVNPEQKITRNIQPKPTSPPSSAAKVIAADTQSLISIPTQEFDFPDTSFDSNLDEDFNSGWNTSVNSGDISGFKSIPSAMRERCSLEDRLQRLAKHGGTPECEEAVVRALQWLKKTQNLDGSWTDQNQAAMTGFALLAYLGHCETPNSAEFGDSVTRAIVYLVDMSMQNGGRIANDYRDKHWCYDHGIATYALAEAATFCIKLGIEIPQLNEATKKAGDWILDNQHDSGSWDYMYDRTGTRGGDNSIGLWHIQALKACKHTGLWDEKVFSKPIKIALKYLADGQHSDGSVGYQNTKGKENRKTMTGGAMLAFQMWGKSRNSLVTQGARYIETNAQFIYNTEHADLYRHYYHAQAMINVGGSSWEAYNKMFRDELLQNQYKNGSWKNVGGGQNIDGAVVKFQGRSKLAKHYRTCLAILMLEVYYRFLPSSGG